jgi:hypothetical protein
MSRESFDTLVRFSVYPNNTGDYDIVYKLDNWKTTRKIKHAKWWSMARDEEMALNQESVYIEYCFHQSQD